MYPLLINLKSHIIMYLYILHISICNVPSPSAGHIIGIQLSSLPTWLQIIFYKKKV